MKVATSPDFLQSVIDHPEVFPWLVPDGVTQGSLADMFDQGITLEFETGGFFFHQLGEGIYDAHLCFLPGTENAIECGQEAARYMFCATDCNRILARVPLDNPKAYRFAEKMGFVKEWLRPRACLRNGEQHDMQHFALTLDVWAREKGVDWTARQCIEMGQRDKGLLLLYRHQVMQDNRES